MAISFACECGNTLRVKDGSEGRRSMCPQCKAITIIPGSVFVSAAIVPKVEIEEPTSRKPWWKDPIVLSWFLGPAIVLGGVLFYLNREARKERIANFITKMKAKADRLAKEGKFPAAMETYKSIFKVVAGNSPSSPQRLAELDSAKSAMIRVEHEIALINQVAKSKRLEDEKRKALEVANKAKEDAEMIEAIRLVALDATVEGDAWVNLDNGGHQILPGLKLILFWKTIERSEVDSELREMRRQISPQYERLSTWVENQGNRTHQSFASMMSKYELLKSALNGIDNTLALEANDRVNVPALYAAARLCHSPYRDDVLRDVMWPTIVGKAKLYETHTDLSGHYKFEGLPGGNFCVYAIHSTQTQSIEWLIPQSLTKKETIKLDVFNGNAFMIQENP